MDYYLRITGMSEEEFYRTKKAKRVEKLKDVNVPLHPKRAPNEERFQPFMEYMVAEMGKKEHGDV